MVEIFDRYDRQLRLWGNHGQKLIEKAHIITVIDNTTQVTKDLLYETWKNLVLIGIKHLTLVNLSGQEIEVHKSKLVSLNKDVLIDCAANLIENKPTILVNVRKDLQDDLFNRSTSVTISCNITGMCGHIQNYIAGTHFVFDSHNENKVPDLRLKNPWPEYQNYLNSFNEVLLDSDKASTVPYPVILYQIIKNFGNQLSTKEIKDQLDRFYLSNINENAIYDINFEQAKRFAYVCNSHEDFISKILQPIFDQINHDRTATFDVEQRKYLTMLQALQTFLNHELTIPFCGELPDLESSTENFNNLKMIFRNKFNNDHASFRKYIVNSSNEPISINDSGMFIKNLTNLTYLKPPDYNSNLDLSSMIQEREFINYWNHYSGKTKLKSKFLEINSYSTTTIFAGLVSQEMIKFITHQFIPIEHVIFFNAVTNYTETLQL